MGGSAMAVPLSALVHLRVRYDVCCASVVWAWLQCAVHSSAVLSGWGSSVYAGHWHDRAWGAGMH